MAFCSSCGNEVPAGAGFCAKCGQQMSAPSAAQPASQPGAGGTPQPASQPGAGGTPQPASQPGAGGTPQPASQPGAGGTPQPAAQPGAGGGQMTSNVAGMLCYVLTLITGILFLVLEPYNRDPFVRFHAFQAIFFCVAAMVLSIAVAIIPWVGWILSPFLMLGLMVLWVVLMFQAYQNKKWKLPVIGDLAEKQV